MELFIIGLIAIVIHLIPFYIGFFLSFKYSMRILSNKKSKLYIKSEYARTLVVISFAFIGGSACIYILSKLGIIIGIDLSGI